MIHEEDKMFLALAAALLVAIIAGAFVQPYFEARAFNRCTGGHATYWEAAFTELRAMQCNP